MSHRQVAQPEEQHREPVSEAFQNVSRRQTVNTRSVQLEDSSADKGVRHARKKHSREENPPSAGADSGAGSDTDIGQKRGLDKKVAAIKSTTQKSMDSLARDPLSYAVQQKAKSKTAQQQTAQQQTANFEENGNPDASDSVGQQGTGKVSASETVLQEARSDPQSDDTSREHTIREESVAEAKIIEQIVEADMLPPSPRERVSSEPAVANRPAAAAVPQVHIGQVDVVVVTEAKAPAKTSSAPASGDFSSRNYLRRL
ncbi:MAG: hypothetical protein R8K53_00550 [Mariprofundaceae bacterium]